MHSSIILSKKLQKDSLKNKHFISSKRTMFKTILRNSVNILFQNPKIIRLALMTLVFFSIVRMYFIVYYFNTFLIYKYESGIQLSDAFIYILDKLNNQGLMMTIILIAIVIVGYLWLHPIGDASIVSALENPEQSTFKSFIKGSGKFFPMLEYSGLSTPFGMFTFLTAVLRLYLMDVYDNIFVDMVIRIRGLIVVFSSVCRSYARIIIATEWGAVFDAIKKSTVLAISNLGLSLKLMVIEVLLLLRFLIIWALIVGIPVLMISIAVRFDAISNPIVENIIRTVAILLLLFLAYINCIAEAFFLTYWHQAYKAIK